VNSKEGEFAAADLLHDTVRTLQVYYIPMRSHALHIYHSAFVTMPKCSLQQILAQGDTPSSLCKLISPRASQWGQFTGILESHESVVSSVAFLPDGKRIVSGLSDHTVRIWNAVSFEELAKLEGHQDPIWCVAVSPDGTHIASGSYDCTVRIWNAVSFEELAKLESHQDPIRSVAFSPDGTHIASGSNDGTVRIWNAISFEELAKLEGHHSWITSVVFSLDSTMMSSQEATGATRAWTRSGSNDGEFAPIHYRHHVDIAP
jgi:WD40 repeat protein